MGSIIFIGIIVGIAGLYLSFNIGANDVANTVSTSVGSRALTIKRAIILAGIFEFLGAFLLGDQVAQTIKNGFVNPEIFISDPIGFAFGMTAAILATSIWLQFATFRGLPVSTTHSIVGAVLGFAIVQGGFLDVRYEQLFAIFLSWIISPLIGGAISYVVLRFILRSIIDTESPSNRVKIFLPIMMAFTVSVLSYAFMPRILSNWQIENTQYWSLLICSSIGLLNWLVFYYFSHRTSKISKKRRLELFYVESLFAKAQAVTACFLSFAHGSNDVANAIGPASAVWQAATSHSVSESSQIPKWLLFIGAIGIVLGLIVFGRKVIQTIGQKITTMTPTRGFSAEFGASVTILIGSLFGIPLSTTQVLVGAVIGVGLARGISGIDLVVISKITRSWLLTIPATALISAFFCVILKFFL